MAIRITDNYLKKAIPADNQKILSLRIETNLSVQIKRTKQNTITRSFVFRSVLLNGKSYSEYLGSVYDLSISEARMLAEERRNLLKRGLVPKLYIKKQLEENLKQKKKNEVTLKTAVDYYLAKRVNLTKNTHIHDITALNAIQCLLDIPLIDLKDSQLPFDLVNAAVAEGKISKARLIASFLKQICETAIDYKILSENPFLRLSRIIPAKAVTHFESVRPDFIQEDLTVIFKEMFKHNKITQTNTFFLLGMFTLLRPSEVNQLKKSNWDKQKQLLFVEKTKTLKNGWTVQTNEYLDAVLSFVGNLNTSNRFFESSKAASCLNDFCRRHNLTFTAHGWRSAGMSWLVQNNIPLHVANALLTHKIADAVTTSYMRSDLPNERKTALRLWNEFIIMIMKTACPHIYSIIFDKIQIS